MAGEASARGRSNRAASVNQRRDRWAAASLAAAAVVAAAEQLRGLWAAGGAMAA